jgi:hypothetical protein
LVVGAIPRQKTSTTTTQETDKSRASTRFLALTLHTLFAVLAPVQGLDQEFIDRLMIVSTNSGHVVYHDRRDELFYVTPRHFLGLANGASGAACGAGERVRGVFRAAQEGEAGTPVTYQR